MTPRTLDALRSAVARVLTARGEAPDALRVDAQWSHGGSRRAVALVAAGSPSEFAATLSMWVAPEGARNWDAAAGEAWAEVMRRLTAADAKAWLVAHGTAAALAAARAVEAGE